MARGNQGRPIYADDSDRKMWLTTLGEACGKTGWRVHAYVMMGNHYHLLVETPEANLVAGMKWVQSTYTQRYNSRHEVFGHLYQGRYKALVVDPQAGNSFEVVSTYIHLNPARAKLVRVGKGRLRQYRWSSYPLYLKGKRERPAWLEVGQVLGNIGLELGDRDGYEAYLEGRRQELGIKAGRAELNEEWKMIRRGWYLGGDGFRARLLKLAKGTLAKRKRASYMGEAKGAHGQAEAERLLALGLRVFGLRGAELSHLPKGMAQKRVLAWWLRERTTVARRWLSEQLRMGDESGVSLGIRLVKEGSDAELEKSRKRLLRSID